MDDKASVSLYVQIYTMPHNIIGKEPLKDFYIMETIICIYLARYNSFKTVTEGTFYVAVKFKRKKKQSH